MEQYKALWAQAQSETATIQEMNDLAIDGWTLHTIIPLNPKSCNNTFGVLMIKYHDD